jgi:hypothetical protein
MGDLEFFGGMDGSGEYNAAAFEKFKERMKAAAAQLKAIQKQEQKQKQSEEELIKILLKFIQSGKKTDIMLLVIRLLEQNVPAGFIVSILLISNPDIQKELKIKLLPASVTEDEKNAVEASQNRQENKHLPQKYMGEHILPLKIKVAIANWINEIQKRVNDNPDRVIKTTLTPEDQVELTVIQLGAFCMRDFLNDNKVENEYSRLKDFVSFFMNETIHKAKEDLKNRKLRENDK